ncbi:Uncharacterized protein FKW44_015473, partial [Caligus rogercresseyi]
MEPQEPGSRPTNEAICEEDDDRDGVHMQIQACLDLSTIYRGHSRLEDHDQLPEDDWAPVQQPQIAQDTSERLSPNCGTTDVLMLPRILTRKDVEQ